MSTNPSSDFIPLAAYRGVCKPGQRAGGNVIKASLVAVQRGGTVSPVDDGEPDVLVHRDGDRIVKIELTCRCGRTSTVVFDYT